MEATSSSGERAGSRAASSQKMASSSSTTWSATPEQLGIPPPKSWLQQQDRIRQQQQQSRSTSTTNYQSGGAATIGTTSSSRVQNLIQRLSEVPSPPTGLPHQQQHQHIHQKNDGDSNRHNHHHHHQQQQRQYIPSPPSNNTSAFPLRRESLDHTHTTYQHDHHPLPDLPSTSPSESQRHYGVRSSSSLPPLPSSSSSIIPPSGQDQQQPEDPSLQLAINTVTATLKAHPMVTAAAVWVTLNLLGSPLGLGSVMFWVRTVKSVVGVVAGSSTTSATVEKGKGKGKAGSAGPASASASASGSVVGASNAAAPKSGSKSAGSGRGSSSGRRGKGSSSTLPPPAHPPPAPPPPSSTSTAIIRNTPASKSILGTLLGKLLLGTDGGIFGSSNSSSSTNPSDVLINDLKQRAIRNVRGKLIRVAIVICVGAYVVVRYKMRRDEEERERRRRVEDGDDHRRGGRGRRGVSPARPKGFRSPSSLPGVRGSNSSFEPVVRERMAFDDIFGLSDVGPGGGGGSWNHQVGEESSVGGYLVNVGNTSSGGIKPPSRVSSRNYSDENFVVGGSGGGGDFNVVYEEENVSGGGRGRAVTRKVGFRDSKMESEYAQQQNANSVYVKSTPPREPPTALGGDAGSPFGFSSSNNSTPSSATSSPSPRSRSLHAPVGQRSPLPVPEPLRQSQQQQQQQQQPGGGMAMPFKSFALPEVSSVPVSEFAVLNKPGPPTRFGNGQNGNGDPSSSPVPYHQQNEIHLFQFDAAGVNSRGVRQQQQQQSQSQSHYPQRRRSRSSSPMPGRDAFDAQQQQLHQQQQALLQGRRPHAALPTPPPPVGSGSGSVGVFTSAPSSPMLSHHSQSFAQLQQQQQSGTSHLFTSTLSKSLNYNSLSISIIPSSIPYHKNLTRLYLAGNSITHLPSTLFQSTPSLAFLDLSENHMEILSSDFSGWGQLKELHVRNNKIQLIDGDGISRCERLEVLDISGNLISFVPAGLFLGLRRLRVCVLSGNPLRGLPPSLGVLMRVPGGAAASNGGSWEKGGRDRKSGGGNGMLSSYSSRSSLKGGNSGNGSGVDSMSNMNVVVGGCLKFLFLDGLHFDPSLKRITEPLVAANRMIVGRVNAWLSRRRNVVDEGERKDLEMDNEEDDGFGVGFENAVAFVGWASSGGGDAERVSSRKKMSREMFKGVDWEDMEDVGDDDDDDDLPLFKGKRGNGGMVGSSSSSRAPVLSLDTKTLKRSSYPERSPLPVDSSSQLTITRRISDESMLATPTVSGGYNGAVGGSNSSMHLHNPAYIHLQRLLSYLRDVYDLDPKSRLVIPVTVASLNDMTDNNAGTSTTTSGGGDDDPDAPGLTDEQREKIRKRQAPERRMKVCEEVLSTERTYVKELQALVDLYVAGLEKDVLTGSDINLLFSNVRSILLFHKSHLLPDLEEAIRHPNQPIGEVFLRAAPFFKMYSAYYNNFDNANAFVAQMDLLAGGNTNSTSSVGSFSSSSSSGALTLINPSLLQSSSIGPGLSSNARKAAAKKFRNFLKNVKTNPLHSQISLQAYLILPVQRLPRYKLLVDQLLECTGPNHVDKASLRVAAEQVRARVLECNDKKREQEEVERGLGVMARIKLKRGNGGSGVGSGGSVGADLFNHARIGRRFLKEGVVRVVKVVEPRDGERIDPVFCVGGKKDRAFQTLIGNIVETRFAADWLPLPILPPPVNVAESNPTLVSSAGTSLLVSSQSQSTSKLLSSSFTSTSPSALRFPSSGQLGDIGDDYDMDSLAVFGIQRTTGRDFKVMLFSDVLCWCRSLGNGNGNGDDDCELIRAVAINAATTTVEIYPVPAKSDADFGSTLHASSFALASSSSSSNASLTAPTDVHNNRKSSWGLRGSFGAGNGMGLRGSTHSASTSSLMSTANNASSPTPPPSGDEAILRVADRDCVLYIRGLVEDLESWMVLINRSKTS
ncbi:hypothetical protein HDU76_009657 [Blyttiomyces sp. JEL0837]|nr:hypothetical protein HDU76_009657 [Blyttiomyces sp. JEL0837]